MDKEARYIPRLAEDRIRNKLGERQVVVVEGARQVGKTTTVRRICSELGGTYRTLDDPDTLAEASDDLKGFMSQVEDASPMVIEEIQRMPRLILEAKRRADNEQRPGMFILVVSSDRRRMMAEVSELAGRASTVTMRPMCLAEVSGNAVPAGSKGVVQSMYDGTPPPASPPVDLDGVVGVGGYPRRVINPQDTDGWLADYISVLSSSIREATASRTVDHMPGVLRHAARMLGEPLNIQRVAWEMNKGRYTVSKLFDLLFDSFVLEPLWGDGTPYRRKHKQAKTPQVYLNDTGLAAALLGVGGVNVTNPTTWEQLLRNMVLCELRVDMGLNMPSFGPNVSYFSEHGGLEIDFLVSQGPTGELLPIEVKAASKVRTSDFKHLKEFRRIAGERCKRAIVMYGGDEPEELDRGILAWPISSLFTRR